MAPKSVVEIEVDGKVVPISNPEKVYFPTHGETKLDLVNYYLAVAESADGGDGRAADPVAALPGRRDGQVVVPEARAGVAP